MRQVNMLQVLLIGIMLFLTGYPFAAAQSTTKGAQPSPVANAEALMRQGKFSEAKSSLRALVEKMPAGWKPVTEKGDDVFVAYWDLEHFRTCAVREGEFRSNKRVVWAQPSYSKAYYLLAYMSLEAGNKDEAKRYVDKGLELEPDHPTLLGEKGAILQMMADYEGSVRSCDAVVRSKGCVTNYEKARALRCKGVGLIELGKLDEAEKAFNESLQIAPNNKQALNELAYIRRIRSGAPPKAPIGLIPNASEQVK
jgi:Flp pilus assembly protein TadD